jgi:hypothetical protein
MFGTLIIQLPSVYSGGELVVQHKGTKKVYDMAKDNEFQFQFIAFFADCEHELKPVTSGYRLCLVYNLIHPGTGALPTSFNLTNTVTNVVKVIKLWEEDPIGPNKVAILLEHKYTQAGLSFMALKGEDLAKAEVLRKVKEQINLDVHLALITYHELGYPDDDVRSYGRRRRDVKNVKMVVIDREIQANHWINMDDNSLAGYDDKTIDEEEIFPEGSLKNQDPTREEIAEATGNEGASMDRWYERAALIIRPHGRTKRQKINPRRIVLWRR